MRYLKVVLPTILLALSFNANASTVTGGSLLSGTDANQLDTWLGAGDHNFTNIWSGTAGVSTATDFHAAVDGSGPTFSIYGITYTNGDTGRIGGYTSLDWAGNGYATDTSAFLFNLDTAEAQFIQQNNASIYRNSTYFSTFGGGHDIWGGYNILGTGAWGGYDYSHTYDHGQGRISVDGDSGSGWTTGYGSDWTVSSLEVYNYNVSTVPVPAAAWLFGSALLGFFGFSRRKAKV